jgi:hypothetical protein
MKLILFCNKRDLAFSMLAILFPKFDPMPKKIFLA